MLTGVSMKSRTYRFGVQGLLSILAAIFIFASAPAGAATIVALGASNTYGKGVARNQAYPAQLEAILRAKGANVRVVNAGIKSECQRLIPAQPSRIFQHVKNSEQLKMDNLTATSRAISQEEMAELQRTFDLFRQMNAQLCVQLVQLALKFLSNFLH